MTTHSRGSFQNLREMLCSWNYSSYDTATYLILATRKHCYGAHEFRKWPLCVERSLYPACKRTFKSLDGEFSDTDSVDADANEIPVTPSRPYHASMEGGLDDYNLLQIGSPKGFGEKITDEFLCPRIPTPNKPNHDVTVINSLSPARSADSVFQEANSKTPVREKWRNIVTPMKNIGSPARRNVFGSIERGLDRFRLMLTPRTSKDKKKLRTMYYNANSNKRAFNVSATASTDPDCVISELKSALNKIGIECEQKGYCLIGKTTDPNGKPVKFELEVVALESLDILGIRRKRQNGESLAYVKIIEKILTLTGVCQLPPKKALQPLQTTV